MPMHSSINIMANRVFELIRIYFNAKGSLWNNGEYEKTLEKKLMRQSSVSSGGRTLFTGAEETCLSEIAGITSSLNGTSEKQSFFRMLGEKSPCMTARFFSDAVWRELSRTRNRHVDKKTAEILSRSAFDWISFCDMSPSALVPDSFFISETSSRELFWIENNGDDTAPIFPAVLPLTSMGKYFTSTLPSRKHRDGEYSAHWKIDKSGITLLIPPEDHFHWLAWERFNTALCRPDVWHRLSSVLSVPVTPVSRAGKTVCAPCHATKNKSNSQGRFIVFLKLPEIIRCLSRTFNMTQIHVTGNDGKQLLYNRSLFFDMQNIPGNVFTLLFGGYPLDRILETMGCYTHQPRECEDRKSSLGWNAYRLLNNTPEDFMKNMTLHIFSR